MGNQLTAPSRLTAAEAVSDLPGVTYKDSLGGGRFFKSALCVHDDGGLVVVKVYAKRPDGPDVRPYKERLAELRAKLAGLDYPHAWPAQRVVETERGVFLLRQFLHANLAQRVSTRPFLTLIEKRWLAYQLLLALAQCHGRGVCHGDIKPENVGLTSWDWAFLIDFAPYKPTLLPADNPADFSFFFDTSGRRRCYLAPERFVDPAVGLGAAAAVATPLTPAMDVFSLGCVLAELFLDGQPLFDYSRLLAYRLGTGTGAALPPALEKVHPSVRGMVAHMLQRDPAARHGVDQYLQEAAASLALPPYLASVVHPFYASMLRLDTDARVALVSQEYDDIKAQLLAGSDGGGSGSSDGSGNRTASLSPAVERHSAEGTEGHGQEAAEACVRPPLQQEVAGLLSDAQACLKQLEGRGGSRGSSRGGTPLHTPRDRSAGSSSQAEAPAAAQHEEAADRAAGQAAGGTQTAAGEQQQVAAAESAAQQAERAAALSAAPPHQLHEGMVLVAVLLCTLLRGSRLQEHKARVVGLLCDSAAYCDDETRLQRVLPYLVAATAEPLAAVKCVALRAIARVLAQVRGVPPSEAKVFTEYVLPSLSLLPSEAELAVQVEYASCIAQLAATAQAFLEQLQRRRLQPLAGSGAATSGSAPGSGSGSSMGSTLLLNFDEEMGHLRTGVERVVQHFLVGPHAETKLALLPHLARLAAFAGRRDTADVLLPSLLTFFNSQSWQVRAAFYSAFVGVCPSLGPEGVAAIVLPFLDRLVGDPEPAVVAEAVQFLARICSDGLLRKRHILLVAARLCSRPVLGPAAPTPVRAAAVAFLAAAASQLSAADIQAQLVPLALPHLEAEPLSFTDMAQISQAFKADSPETISGGDGTRVQRHRRPPVVPMRPGYPPPPMPPLPPQPQQRFTSESAGRRSLDSLAAPAPVSRPGVGTGSSSVVMSGAAPAGTAGGPASRSILLPPPTASTYSLQVDPRFLHHGSSYLSAALEQSMMAAAGVSGHLVSSGGSTAAQQAQRGGGARLHTSAHWGPADSGMQLVARARRSLPQAPGLTRMPAPLMQQQWGEPGGTGQPGSPSGGGGVRDAMSAALAAGMPGGGADAAHSQHVAPWYPRGVLVAHLAEHKKAINRLAVAGCGTFFASASSDETIKVWDCRRLEKDVSFRSRLTYTAQSGRITSVAACQDSQSIASGSAAGSIHVWRVEYAGRAGAAPERYTGIISTRQFSPGAGAVLDLAAWGPSLLVYSTARGGLSAWDLRAGGNAWALPCPPVQGALERFVLDPTSQNWLLGGTSRGWLCLWDVRFRLPVNSWQHPAGAPIAALALASSPPQRLGLPGTSAPLVYVATGEQEVGLWDVAEAKCQQVLRVLRPGASDAARHQVPSALASPAVGLGPPRGADMMSRARQLAISELQAPPARQDGVRVLLPTAGGQLLAGGADRTVRCWDSGRPAQSYVVCAPPPPAVPPGAATVATAAEAGVSGAAAAEAAAVDVPQYRYATRNVGGVPVLEESCSLQRLAVGAADREQRAAEYELLLARQGWAERAAALCHQLAVTDLARVEASEPLLLSAGADGCVKAWR